MIRILLILGLLWANLSIRAQDPEKLKLYRSSPVWIAMIDSRDNNYFEVVKAFELYWEGREMPLEEEDILGERFSKEEKKLGIFRLFSGASAADRELATDIKRFRNWQREVLPLVQEDGRILSKEEELEIYRNQQPQ